MNTPILSIILPAFNEERVIAANLVKILEFMDGLKVDYELIVVNDGSQDNTLGEVQGVISPRLKCITYAQNGGKGYAINQGVRVVQGKYILFMDVDLSTDLQEIPKFLTTIANYKVDMIIGNRKIDPSYQLVKQPFYRRFFGQGFTWLSSLFIGRFYTDYTCGFKMFTAAAAKTIFSRQRIYNWAFDTELIFIALTHHLVIHEMAVIWRHQGDSKVRLGREIFTSLMGLIQIRLNVLQGFYR